MDIPLGQLVQLATFYQAQVSWKNGLITRYLSKKKMFKDKTHSAGSYISAMFLLNTASAYTTTVFSVIQHSLLPFCRIAAILCAQSRQPTTNF